MGVRLVLQALHMHSFHSRHKVNKACAISLGLFCDGPLGWTLKDTTPSFRVYVQKAVLGGCTSRPVCLFPDDIVGLRETN